MKATEMVQATTNRHDFGSGSELAEALAEIRRLRAENQHLSAELARQRAYRGGGGKCVGYF